MTYNLCFMKKIFFLYNVIIFSVFNKVLSESVYRVFNKSFRNPYSLAEDNKLNTLLEDTFPSFIYSFRFCKNSMCKETYEEAGYPYKQILEVVRSAKVKTETLPSIQHLVTKDRKESPQELSPFDIDSFEDPKTPTCQAYYKNIYPLKGKSVDGKLYFIVNIPEYQQRTNITICRNSDVACGDESTLPENYQYQCKQDQEEVTLMSFPINQNITKDSQLHTTFKIPSGCICQRSRIQN